MKRGTPDHPKTFHLAELLDIEVFGAVGLLEMLWHFTAAYAPRGDVGQWPDARIARALGWRRAPAKVVSALVEAGWLDTDSAHRLLVHDWAEHAEQSVARKLERAGQAFAIATTSRQLAAVAGPLPSLAMPLAEPSLASPAAIELELAAVDDPAGRQAGRANSEELKTAQAECEAELHQTAAATGMDPEVLLATHSRTPKGRVITSIARCDRVGWIRVLTARLRAKRLASTSDQAHAPPAASSAKAQARENAANAVLRGGMRGRQ